MIKVNVMYLLILLTWYLLFLIFFLFLYLKYSKPYKVKIEKKVESIPENLNPNELSMLLYHKITPNTLVATIIYLMDQKVIIREGNILRKNGKDVVLSVCQNNVVELLFDTLGNGKTVDVEKIADFCSNNSKCTDFLLAYDIWNNIATKEAMASKQFFIRKMDYELVKWFQYIGYFLVILNVVLKLHFIAGYAILIPAYFLLQYFYKVYKRTPYYQEQFYKWISYKNYLSDTNTIKDLNDNKSWVLIYSVLLNNLDHVENIVCGEQFLTQLNDSLQLCYKKAFLFGNRKI